MPRFVSRELRAYLRCGVLAHGFIRVHCHACGLDRVVAFSCKGRGFCPACGGRRMADTAAHVVERVIPRVPVRQWVLSLPWALRYRLAYDASLTQAVLGLFLRGVFALLRQRARRRGLTSIQCGSVTFIQRFGDALNLNVHFHALVLDGVYARAQGAAPRFHPLPPPGDVEVAELVRTLARRLARLLERRGLGRAAEPTDADPLPLDQPLLAALYAASVSSRIATGPRTGHPVLRVGDRVDVEDLPRLSGPRCATAAGLSLHANVAVPARDRRRLERLCRYVARPSLASQRLSRLPDGRLLYRLKHRWRDGTTGVVFTPGELVEKLAALVPPPRFHLVRYHGVLGPAARQRARIIPGSRDSAPAPSAAPPAPGESGERSAAASGCTTRYSRHAHSAPADKPDRSPRAPERESAPVPPERTSHASRPLRARRLAWADLLRRVFAIDVLQCPRCQGRLRVLAAIHSPHSTRAILSHLDLPARAPPLEPPRHDPWPPDVDGDPPDLDP